MKPFRQCTTQTKSAWAAFALLAFCVVGTVTNTFIVPPELLALLLVGSTLISLFLMATPETRPYGSGWMLGLLLTFGALSILMGIGVAIETLFFSR